MAFRFLSQPHAAAQSRSSHQYTMYTPCDTTQGVLSTHASAAGGKHTVEKVGSQSFQNPEFKLWPGCHFERSPSCHGVSAPCGSGRSTASGMGARPTMLVYWNEHFDPQPSEAEV